MLRTVLIRTPLFSVEKIHWTKKSVGPVGPIHDHQCKYCIMNVLSGQLVERTYDRKACGAPKSYFKNIDFLNPGSWGIIKNDSVLHSIQVTKPGESIHIYIPPIKDVKEYSEETR